MELAPLFRQTRCTRRASALALAVACAAFLPIPAHAANITTTWIGTSGDWLDPAHWTAGIPQNDPLNLYMPFISPGTITLATNLSTSGLYLAQNSLLTITSGHTYTIIPGTFGIADIRNSQIALQPGAVLNVSTNTFLYNATISGDGTYRQSAGQVNLMNGASVSNLVLDHTTLTGNFNELLTISNHADITDSSINAHLIVAPAATINFGGTASSVTLGGTFELNGIANFSGPSSYIGNYLYLHNAGTLNLTGSPNSNSALTRVLSLAPTSLQNSGTIGLNTARLDFSTSTAISNLAGVISADSLSSLRTNSTVHLKDLTMDGPGLLDAYFGLTVDGNAFVHNASLRAISGAGTLHITAYASWNGAAGGSPFNVVIDPNAQLFAGTLSLNAFGKLTNNGSIFIGPDASGNFLNGGLSNVGLLTNTGTITLATSVSGAGQLLNSGLITDNASVVTATRNLSIPFFNSGTITGGLTLNTGTSSGLLSPDVGAAGRTLTISGPLYLLDGAILTSAHNGRILAQNSITLSGNVTADHLTFPSLFGSGTLTLLGTSNACAYSALINGPSLIIDPSAAFPVTNTLSLYAGTLTNNGTLTTAANFNIYAPASLLNNGTLNLGGTVALSGAIAGSGTLTNSGLISATSNSPQSINTHLFNAGTISGTALNFPLGLSGTLTNAGTITGLVNINGLGSSSGLFSGDSAAGPRTLAILNAFTFTDGARISSPNGGLVSATGSLTITGLVSADHFSFSRLALNAGTLELSGPNTWLNFNISGILTSGSPLLHVTPAGALAIGNSQNLGVGTLTTACLFNEGVLYGANSGAFIKLANAWIDNAGTLTLPNFGILADAGTSAIFNSGLLVATASNATISAPLYNSGTVTFNSLGVFTIRSAPLNNGGSASGLFSATTANSTIVLGGPGSPYSLSNATLSGPGFFGGFINLLAPTSVSNFAFSSVTGPGTLDLSGTLACTAGTLTNAQLRLLPSASLNTNPTTLTLANSTLTNLASLPSRPLTLHFSGTSSFLNQGTISLAPTGSLSVPSNLSTSQFTNAGLLAISTIQFQLNIPFTNSGTLSLANSAKLSLGNGGTLSGSVIFAGPGTIADTGLYRDVTLDGVSITGTNSGLTGSFALVNENFAEYFSSSGITLAGPGTLTVANVLTLGSANTFSQGAHVIIPASGTLTLSSKSYSNFPTIDNASLLNLGLTTVTSDAFSSTLLKLANGATFTNAGTINLATSEPFRDWAFAALNPGNAFINSGLFSYSAGDMGSLTIAAPFYNTGTVSLSPYGSNRYSPALSLTGGGSASGLFSAPSSIIYFNAPYTLDNATLSAMGRNNAPLTLLGNVNISALTINHNLLGSGSLTGGGLLWSGGTLSNAGGLHINASATVSIYSEVQYNSFPVNFAFYNRYDSPAKTLDGITLTIDSGSSAAAGMSNPGAINSDSIAFKNGAQFINNGSFVDAIRFFSFTNLDNHPQNAFINNGLSSFSLGMLGYGTLTFGVPFFNTGTLALSADSHSFPNALLNIAAGGSASGLFSSSSTPSAIRFSAPYTLHNATLSGNISNAAPLTLLGNVRADGLAINHNLLGSGFLAGSAITWNSGTLSNAGGILINGTASASFSPPNATTSLSANFLLTSSNPTLPKILDSITLTIAPACSAAFTSSTATPPPIEFLTLQNGAKILNHGSFYTYLPNLIFASADSNPNNAFINTGIFGRHAFSSSSNTDRTTIYVPFHNAGLIDIQQGQIDFAGGYFNDTPITPNTADFHFAPGTALYFSGTNYDFGNDLFDLGPGGLAGVGTVHANFLSNGTIDPGGSLRGVNPSVFTGTLTIAGNLTLNPDASTHLDIDVATFVLPGADPDLPAADLLDIRGTFFANGTLDITFLNPLPVLPTSSLTLISATTFLGNFLNAPYGARLTDTTGGTSFLVTYTPTSLTLSDFQPVPEPTSLLLLTPTLLLLRRKRPIPHHLKH